MHNRRLPVGHNCMGTLHVSFHGIPLPLVSRLRKLAERLYADKSVKSLVQQDVMRWVQAKQGYVPSEKVSRGGSAVPGGVWYGCRQVTWATTPHSYCLAPSYRNSPPLLALRRMALKPW